MLGVSSLLLAEIEKGVTISNPCIQMTFRAPTIPTPLKTYVVALDTITVF